MREFRFAYFTELYEATVSFYRDGLELPVLGEWNRSADDRGTIFEAASGMIEVLARPHKSDHLYDARPPQGAFMVIEVDQVDAFYRRILEKALPLQQELKDKTWGHRSFCVRDPNGLALSFFSKVKKDEIAT